jgi:SPP1 gp7 family putative phage head morphogenesis protein
MPAHKLLQSGKSTLAKRKNELWYKRRLKVVAEDAKSEVVPTLNEYIAKLDAKTSNAVALEQADKVMVNREVQAIIEKAKTSFVMPIDPKRTAQGAAALNLQSTDQWWVAQMRSQGIALQPAMLPKPTLRDPHHFGDATAKQLTNAQLEALKKQRQKAQIGLRTGSVSPLSTLSIMAGKQEVQIAFAAAVDTNVALISSIAPQYYDRFQEIMFEQVQSAERWETLADRLREGIAQVNNLSDYRVNLIARDQTAKMTSAFNEARSASVGITQYTWQTAGDERVRPTHRENDGKLLSFDDPPTETGNPGDDVNCRCVAIPYVEEADEDQEAA